MRARASDTSRIRSIVSLYETKGERAPNGSGVLREIKNNETKPIAALRTIEEIKNDLNDKLPNINNCKNTAVVGGVDIYRATNNSVNIRRLSESGSDSDTDSDSEEEVTALPERWNSTSGKRRIFGEPRFGPVSRVAVYLICDYSRAVGRYLLRRIPCVTPENLTAVAVLTSASVPRMVTNLVIYPSCRLIFGTLYPAYASYKAVRTKNVKEYVKWMMYWIVFALFTCAETFTDVFFSWFPFYYEVKILLVLWLLSPATKGSSILYRKFVHPALCRREQEIDEYISKAKDQGYHTVLNLGTKGVNYATAVIMQTAIKGGGGLVQQLRRSYSLSDLSVTDDHSDCRSQQELDEVDDVVLTDPRLVRRNTGRGRSPRTQSSPRVDMIFPEVDVLGHNRSVRDSKLSQIRSSEDISSAYVPENSSSQDLMRTASVGGSSRTRSKVTRSTFTSIKRPGAAEDSDVVIEEMEDDGVPSSLLQNILPQADATVCLPYSNDIISQYLKFIVNNEIRERLNNNSDVDKEYQQYLKLKEFFDSEGSKVAEKKGVIESSSTVNLESESSKDTEKLSNIIESSDTANPESESSKVIGKSSIIESFKIPKFNLETVHLESENKPLLQEELLTQEKVPVHSQSVTLAPHVESINQDKKNEGDFPKIPDISILENNVKLDVSNLIGDEISIKSADSLNPLTHASKRDSLCEESRSIGASSSNLSSDDDMDDGEFTTPNSSPVMKNKINKGGKYKKRHAPPPPPSHSSNVDKSETENIDKQPESSMKNDPNHIISLGESANTNHSDQINNGKESEKLLSHPPEKRKQRTKNRSMVKGGSKNESPFSKLIHLPSKFAFWNTGEGSDKLSASDNNEESNDSIHDKSSLSDYDSATNMQTCQADVKPNIKTGTEIPVISEDKLGHEEQFKTVAIGAADSIADGNDPKLKNDEDKSQADNEKSEQKLDHFAHIPLKIETLILHTESKSTDV